MEKRLDSYPAIVAAYAAFVVIGRATGPLDRNQGPLLAVAGLLALVCLIPLMLARPKLQQGLGYFIGGPFTVIPAGCGYLPGKYGHGGYTTPWFLVVTTLMLVGCVRLYRAMGDHEEIALPEMRRRWVLFFLIVGLCTCLSVPLMAATDLATGRSPGPLDTEVLLVAGVAWVAIGFGFGWWIARQPEAKQRQIMY